MKLTALLASAAIITATLAPAMFAVAAPVKGVKKICPDGTRVPFKHSCPPPAPDPEPEPEREPGEAFLSISDISVTEGGTATVTVTRSGDLTGAVTFDMETSAGTATADLDYFSREDSKSIAIGATTATFQVPTVNDTTVESTETVNVVLSNVVGATVTDDTSVISILDNDVAPPPPPPILALVSVADVSIAEDGGTATVTITRVNNGSSLNANVSYITSNGTATAGSDYTTTSGNLTILANATSNSFTIPITNDATVENNETINVTLTAGSNTTVSDGTGVVTIIDNDVTPLPPPTTPAGGDELAESLEGYTWRTVTDHDFLTSLMAANGTGAIPVQMPANDPVGAYRQYCEANQLAYNDHILYNGEPGKSHLHDFNGNSGVTASSTFTSLLAGGGSSCNRTPHGKAVQRSSYWMPALLTGLGQVVRYDNASLYYKRLPKTHVDCGNPTGLASGPKGICLEIPNGLKSIVGSKMVAGQWGPVNLNAPTATTHSSQFYFRCIAPTPIKQYKDLAALSAGSPTCTKLDMVIQFPNCWDGKYLWKTDRTHLRYMKRYNDGKTRCEPSHPYLITEVTLFYQYTVTGLNLNLLKLASDYMDPTQPRGWSLHSDLHIVWDARVKRMMHDGCIDQHLNCSGGDLGNGKQLIGAGQPSYGWTNPNRLVPEPPMPPNMVMP